MSVCHRGISQRYFTGGSLLGPSYWSKILISWKDKPELVPLSLAFWGELEVGQNEKFKTMAQWRCKRWSIPLIIVGKGSCSNYQMTHQAVGQETRSHAFISLPHALFSFFWTIVKAMHVCLCLCVCRCIFLYCLSVCNSMGSFIEYGGRPTRCLAGEYSDELTPAWRGWLFSFRTGCQRRDLQKAPMPHKEILWIQP